MSTVIFETSVDPLFSYFWRNFEKGVYGSLLPVAQERNLEWRENDVKNLVRAVTNSQRRIPADRLEGLPFPFSWLLKVKSILNACAREDPSVSWFDIRESVQTLEGIRNAVEKTSSKKMVEDPSRRTDLPKVLRTTSSSRLDPHDSRFDFDDAFSHRRGNEGVFLPSCEIPFAFFAVESKEDEKELFVVAISGVVSTLLDVDAIEPILEGKYLVRPVSVKINFDKIEVRFATEEEAQQLVSRGFEYRGKKYEVRESETVRIGPRDLHVLTVLDFPHSSIASPFSAISEALDATCGLKARKGEPVGPDFRIEVGAWSTKKIKSLRSLVENGLNVGSVRYSVREEKTSQFFESPVEKKEKIKIRDLPPQLSGRQNIPRLVEHLNVELEWDAPGTGKISTEDVEILEENDYRGGGGDGAVFLHVERADPICPLHIRYRGERLKIERVETRAFFILEREKTADAFPIDAKEIGWNWCYRFCSFPDVKLLWTCSIEGKIEISCFEVVDRKERSDIEISFRKYAPFVIQGKEMTFVSRSTASRYPSVVAARHAFFEIDEALPIDDEAWAFLKENKNVKSVVPLRSGAAVVYFNDRAERTKASNEGKFSISHTGSRKERPKIEKNASVGSSLLPARKIDDDGDAHFSVELTNYEKDALRELAAIETCSFCLATENLLFVRVSLPNAERVGNSVRALFRKVPRELNPSELKNFFLWSLDCDPPVPLHRTKEFEMELTNITGDPRIEVKKGGSTIRVTREKTFCRLISLKDRIYKFGNYELGIFPAKSRFAEICTLKDIQLDYFRKFPNLLFTVSKDRGCSVFVPPYPKRTLGQRKYPEQFEFRSVVFYLGYLQEDSEAPVKAREDFFRLLERLTESNFSVDFENAECARACSIQYVWLVSATHSIDAVATCETKTDKSSSSFGTTATTRVLITIFGEFERAKKLKEKLIVLPDVLRTRKYEPRLTPYQSLLLDTRRLYEAFRSPDESFSIVVGTKKNLDEFDRETGLGPSNVGRNVVPPRDGDVAVYRFSTQETYAKFVELHRNLVENTENVTVRWKKRELVVVLNGEGDAVRSLWCEIDRIAEAM